MADLRPQYNEEAVGANHPTKADVINRAWNIEHEEDGTHTAFMGGNIGIGIANPATSGLLDLTSTTGALIVSRMTTGQRDALTPVDGMIIYNTTNVRFNFRENGAWVSGSGLA